jgi:hypothetical protein
MSNAICPMPYAISHSTFAIIFVSPFHPTPFHDLQLLPSQLPTNCA